MSTELLHTPGKVHTLYDDLESHFFVILYNALHCLKHVRPPGLNMESIFDHAFISPVTGFHYGGSGKRCMYDSHNFTFVSEPLTGLICALLELFRSLKDYSCKHFKKERFPTAVEDVEKLKDCAEIKRLYAEALGSKGWPTVCDKVEDRYLLPVVRRRSKRNPSRYRTSAVVLQRSPLLGSGRGKTMLLFSLSNAARRNGQRVESASDRLGSPLHTSGSNSFTTSFCVPINAIQCLL